MIQGEYEEIFKIVNATGNRRLMGRELIGLNYMGHINVDKVAMEIGSDHDLSFSVTQ